MFDFPLDSRIALPTEDGYFYKRQDRNVMISCHPISGITIFSYLDDFEKWDKKNLGVAMTFPHVLYHGN